MGKTCSLPFTVYNSRFALLCSFAALDLIAQDREAKINFVDLQLIRLRVGSRQKYFIGCERVSSTVLKAAPRHARSVALRGSFLSISSVAARSSAVLVLQSFCKELRNATTSGRALLFSSSESKTFNASSGLPACT